MKSHGSCKAIENTHYIVNKRLMKTNFLFMR